MQAATNGFQVLKTWFKGFQGIQMIKEKKQSSMAVYQLKSSQFWLPIFKGKLRYGNAIKMEGLFIFTAQFFNLRQLI